MTWKPQEERARRSCFHDGASLHFLPHVSEGPYRVVLGERQRPEGTGRRASGAIFHCAFCGNKSLTKDMSCEVTMQYDPCVSASVVDHCVSTCVAFVADSPPFRSTKNLARGDGDGKQRPKAVRQNERTKAQVAVQWTSSRTFGESGCKDDVENGTALQWRTAEEQIEVQSVMHPKLAELP